MTNKEAIEELKTRYRICISDTQGIYVLPNEIQIAINAIEENEQLKARLKEKKIHAHWERTDDGYGCCCSNCGGVIYDGNISKYCPNCGAKMNETEK